MSSSIGRTRKLGRAGTTDGEPDDLSTDDLARIARRFAALDTLSKQCSLGSRELKDLAVFLRVHLGDFEKLPADERAAFLERVRGVFDDLDKLRPYFQRLEGDHA